MPDFDSEIIEIRYSTDLWGPYRFNFPICSSATAGDGAIPFGDTISAVTVKAYLGNVKPSSVLTDFTEITTSVIDPGYAPTFGNDYVVCKFQYPGDTYKGEKVTLIFELTLSSGAKHPFYFQYLKIM